MRAPGEMAGLWTRLAELDEQIATENAEGYDVDVHLDERLALQAERDDLKAWAESAAR